MQFRSFVVIHPSPSRLRCRSGIQFVMVHNIALVLLGGSEEAWSVKVDSLLFGWFGPSERHQPGDWRAHARTWILTSSFELFEQVYFMTEKEKESLLSERKTYDEIQYSLIGIGAVLFIFALLAIVVVILLNRRVSEY